MDLEYQKKDIHAPEIMFIKDGLITGHLADLKTGKELPKFLAKEGANIFIAKQMGEGMKMNLIDVGIKPCLTEAQTIEDAIRELNC